MSDKVTIGMPIRNGGSQTRRALDSLLAQTHTDIEIVISDNCSTDDTPEICRDYAARNDRIRFFQQDENLGIFRNFKFVLNECKTPYFMWACHDDFWAPEFVESNLKALKSSSQAIGSISRVRLIRPDGSTRMAKGTSALTGPAGKRLAKFLRHPSEASRFYSVFRADKIKQCIPPDIDVLGWDYVVLASAIEFGEFIELPEVLMEREAHDFFYYQKHFVTKQPAGLQRWFPAHQLVQKIREKVSLPYGYGCHRALLLLELRQTVQHAIFRFTALAKLVGFFANRGRLNLLNVLGFAGSLVC